MSPFTPDDTAVGAGAQNTRDILTWCDDRPIAASVADDYVWPNGQTDGFLPSKDELNLMYENLHNQNPPLGGFSNLDYWSSSEFNFFSAWGQIFGNGNPVDYTKSSALKVRAARAFE